MDLFGNKKRDAEIAKLREEVDALKRWADEVSLQLGRPGPLGGGGPPKPPGVAPPSIQGGGGPPKPPG